MKKFEFGKIRQNSGQPNLTEFGIFKFGFRFGKPNNSVKFAFGQKRIPKKWIRPRLADDAF